jgi:hypothetical protein
MKRRKSVFVFFIGLGVYLSLIKINLDSYTGLCIESFQSNRINRSYAIFGIDDNGKRKTVKVKLSNDELPIEGSRVIVSKRIIGHGLERELSNPVDSPLYLLTGEINMLLMGVQVPFSKDVYLEVYQNGKRTNYQLEGRDYFVELHGDKDASLVFSCEGYKTKSLHLPEVNLSSYHVFRANCVFEEGEGTTERTLNLDSILKIW